MKKLTVFTPTFNRIHLLPRLYASLKSQTNKNFIWLVIDDGSSDGTEALINSYIEENIIEIIYFWKENEGMHSAHNLAYEKITTDWNTCIDSDDMMTENAVQSICQNIKNIEDDESYYAIVGLDADQHGAIIGTEFPTHLQKVKFCELYLKHQVKGDKKIVSRTAVMNKLASYPIFEGEKLVPLDYKILLADQLYFVKPINETWCLVEYQEDGSTLNMLKQYRRNPRGFAFSRISRINYGTTLLERFKNAIHLISSSLFSNDYGSLLKIKHILIVLFAIPFGVILNLYIRLKTSKNC